MWLPTSPMGLAICVENSPQLIATTQVEHDGTRMYLKLLTWELDTSGSGSP